LQRFGIDRTARSMWDVPEITQAWGTLHDGNWLETTGTQVRPGSGPVAPASPDEQPEQFIDFAHSLLLSALGSMWARDGSRSEERRVGKEGRWRRGEVACEEGTDERV